MPLVIVDCRREVVDDNWAGGRTVTVSHNLDACRIIDDRYVLLASLTPSKKLATEQNRLRQQQPVLQMLHQEQRRREAMQSTHVLVKQAQEQGVVQSQMQVEQQQQQQQEGVAQAQTQAQTAAQAAEAAAAAISLIDSQADDEGS